MRAPSPLLVVPGLALRLVLAGAAILVGGLSWIPLQTRLAAQSGLERLLLEAGGAERHAETLEALSKEQDPERAKLVVGRALLSQTLDDLARARPPLDETQIAAFAGTADTARRLAEEALPRRPAAWQGHMILGAATYVEWSLLRDRRLVTEARAWEEPLRTAIEMAPGQAEPRRFLTMAYLEIWPMLSEDKRVLTRRMVTEAFSEAKTFRRLARAWLDLNESVDEALEPLPQEPHVFATLQRIFAERGDWQSYRSARERWRELHREELQGQLEEIDTLRRRNRNSEAGRKLQGLLRQIPLRSDAVEILVDGLALLEPGPVPEQTAGALRRWLVWNLDGCRAAGCRLPESTAARLRALLHLEPHDSAEAALAAGDLAEAERLEREADAPKEETWTSYWIAKVPHLLRRREIESAARALDSVPARRRDRPTYLWTARGLAAAAEQRDVESKLDRDLERVSAAGWREADWRADESGRFTLAFSVWVPAEGLEQTFGRGVARGGTPVELFVDGELRSLEILQPGSAEVRLQTPLPRGLHTLEIRAVLGGSLVPGSGRLSTAPR